MADDLDDVIHGRAGWTFDGDVATYCPQEGFWSARIRRPATPAHRSHRWIVTGVHPDGNAAWVAPAGSAHEAVRLAERWVHAQG